MVVCPIPLAVAGRAEPWLAGVVALASVLVLGYALRRVRRGIRHRRPEVWIAYGVMAFASAALAFACLADLLGLLDHMAWADALSDILVDLLLVVVAVLLLTRLVQRRRA